MKPMSKHIGSRKATPFNDTEATSVCSEKLKPDKDILDADPCGCKKSSI
ncbi:MAG: hypothetical protein ACTS8H_02740 [Arsenophonus sp. NC-PE1-MAG3]